eukprot:m.99045 g.99045  ORF g.99045 m.99045 type:complete len:560 (+) comp37026_c0_seq3:190-1869(+)
MGSTTTTAAALFVVLFSVIVVSLVTAKPTPTSAACGECNRTKCQSKLNCSQRGVVLDRCKCCHVCARAAGEPCSTRTVDHGNNCDEGLRCSRNGICKGKSTLCRHGDLWAAEPESDSRSITFCACFNGDTICFKVKPTTRHPKPTSKITAKPLYAVGETIRITCRFPIDPTPALAFIKHNNKTLLKGGIVYKPDSSKEEVIDGVKLHRNTYTITSANSSHSGTYKCTVLSEGIGEMTDSVAIEVKATPTMSTPLTTKMPATTNVSAECETEMHRSPKFSKTLIRHHRVSAKELHVATIGCYVRGSPTPDLTIQKVGDDGKMVDVVIQNGLVDFKDGRHRKDWWKIEVQFNRVLQSDGGVYICNASNACGEWVTHNVTLIVEPSHWTCTFEKGFCPFWHSVTANNVHWTRHSGPTPTKGTGPNHDYSRRDRTGKTGYYIYLESSPPVEKGHQAHLESNWLEPTEEGKELHVDFYYHMHGETVGSLKLVLESESGERTELFSVDTPTKKWKHGRTHTLTIEKRSRLVFIGEKGSGVTGDIALDDIRIIKECSKEALRKGNC